MYLAEGDYFVPNPGRHRGTGNVVVFTGSALAQDYRQARYPGGWDLWVRDQGTVLGLLAAAWRAGYRQAEIDPTRDHSGLLVPIRELLTRNGRAVPAAGRAPRPRKVSLAEAPPPADELQAVGRARKAKGQAEPQQGPRPPGRAGKARKGKGG